MRRTSESYEELNRRYWNEVTPVHENAAAMYPVEQFLAGASTLDEVEVRAMGDVRGLSLLHLQCHFGMDTLSWARLGAEVTGVDISDESIRAARRLAKRAGLDASFLERNVLDLEARPLGRFDRVYTSKGALCWLRDLEAWGRIVANHLNPGGVLYLLEMHPLLYLFDEYDRQPGTLVVDGNYFHHPEPLSDEPGSYPDYADPDYTPRRRSYEWAWSVSDVVNALARAGLRIEEMEEFDRLFFKGFSSMERDEDGWWRLPGMEGRVPMAFSLKARKV